MCPTELDRERLVATVSGVGRARALMFVVLAAVVAGSAGQTGWWPFVVLIASAVLSIYLYRDLDRRRRPEYWAISGWLATQLPLAVGIAITGGARSPALSWLAIAVVSLVARFSRLTIRLGMVFLFLLLLAVTVGVNPTWTFAHPASTLICGGLLFSVWVFAEALLRSDLEHRDHDKVTGLPNQTKFADHLHLALRRRERRGGTISVLALDLDGFRLANDSLGTSAGDQLLRHAGARIARAAVSAEMVARRSADEFLILLTDLGDTPSAEPRQPWVSAERAPQETAHAVQTALSDPIRIGERDIYLGVCIGITLLAEGEAADDHDKTVEQLLSGAQLALSSARSAGPGSITQFDRAQPSSGRRLSLISRLRKAIDAGALTLHYQPTVDLHTGAIKGVEALARWNDAELGMVPPSEFIAVAEETGLIEPLGAWVMDEVARQARTWDQEGMDFEIAFNLSPRQLSQPGLLGNLRASLAAAEVPFDRFVVEITESSALRDFDSTVALLRQMTAEGFRLAIDDFGVELSSLSRLLQIPAHVLKVDQSFIAQLSTSPDAAVMVQMIIQLAEKLGRRPHAEGVETEKQRRFLLENGCQYGQGYLFSKPVPAAEIPALYTRALAAQVMPVPPLPAPGTPEELDQPAVPGPDSIQIPADLSDLSDRFRPS
jgi:diguanylate cyclase (GGDEF)-like protein